MIITGLLFYHSGNTFLTNVLQAPEHKVTIDSGAIPVCSHQTLLILKIGSLLFLASIIKAVDRHRGYSGDEQAHVMTPRRGDGSRTFYMQPGWHNEL